MKIIIDGSPKEIVDLMVQAQGRQEDGVLRFNASQASRVLVEALRPGSESQELSASEADNPRS